MKRLFLILTIICFCFCGCSKSSKNELVAETQVSTTDIDKIVAGEISSYENLNELDNETIKALSVVIRTNLQNENLENKTSSNQEIDSTVYNLVSETSGKVISLSNEDNDSNILIKENNQNEQEWTKEIKKVDVLKFLKNNKISLTSISNIKQINDESGKTVSLNMNGKIIPMETIVNEFNLPSNEITSIENKTTSLKLSGKGDKKDKVFNIEEAKKLSKMGYSYDKILKNQNNSFNIIIK